jgi:hypothetical protein
VLTHGFGGSGEGGAVVVTDPCTYATYSSAKEPRIECHANGPAFAMTTSSLPATALILSTAALLSASSAEVSWTMFTRPGCSAASEWRSVAAAGFRAPAKTMVDGCETMARTRPSPGSRHCNA